MVFSYEMEGSIGYFKTSYYPVLRTARKKQRPPGPCFFISFICINRNLSQNQPCNNDHLHPYKHSYHLVIDLIPLDQYIDP